MPCTSYARPDCSNAYASCGGHDLVTYGCSSDDHANSSASSCDGWPEDVAKDEKARAVHGKWLKTLWTVIDRADHTAERKTRNAKCPPLRHPIKTILRPPTEYVYVIGMSGLPSKVAVYPKRV